MRADNGLTAFGGPPGREHVADRSQEPFKVGRLLFEESADVGTRGGSGATQGVDVLDLREREAEATALGDECEHSEYVGGIDAIAGGRSVRGRQDAARLVQSERPRGYAAPARYLPDPQSAVCHSHTVNPAPRGKIKPRIGFAPATDIFDVLRVSRHVGGQLTPCGDVR